jgi:hypothetical protein
MTYPTPAATADLAPLVLSSICARTVLMATPNTSAAMQVTYAGFSLKGEFGSASSSRAMMSGAAVDMRDIAHAVKCLNYAVFLQPG